MSAEVLGASLLRVAADPLICGRSIVEHPRVVSFTSRAVKNAKMAKRVQVMGLDIAKDPLPRGFDLVLISNVLHGQGVRENRALLRSAYRCLNQRGGLSYAMF